MQRVGVNHGDGGDASPKVYGGVAILPSPPIKMVNWTADETVCVF